MNVRQKLQRKMRFRDISWLMPAVDLPEVIKKLGSSVETDRGDEIRAYCPDHHLFTGRRPSNADWAINKTTGECFCFTEARGSNILWIVARMLKCTPDEAVRFLTGGKGISGEEDIAAAVIRNKMRKLKSAPSEEKVPPVALDNIEKDLENRYVSERLYEYFIHPPGKMPTNITKETVDFFRVFERSWGRYVDRAVIPFFMFKKLVGFCAVDLLGKDEWCNRHPTVPVKKYRKTLYPPDFLSGNCLFGYDNCTVGAEYLMIAEGAREIMKLWQEGFPNSVAALGSYLSDSQMELIAKLAPKKVIPIFDGDRPGREAAERVKEKVGRLLPVQICDLPDGIDPKNLDRKEVIEVLLANKIKISC